MNTDKQAQLFFLLAELAVIRRGFNYVDTDEGRAPLAAAMKNKEKEINELSRLLTAEELYAVHHGLETVTERGAAQMVLDLVGNLIKNHD